MGPCHQKKLLSSEIMRYSSWILIRTQRVRGSRAAEFSAKRLVVLVTMLTPLLLIVQPTFASEVRREPLDRLWEEHMLEGTSAVYLQGKRRDAARDKSFESARGSPAWASSTNRGIVVQDFGEWRILSLKAGGGWDLGGGLLGEVKVENSTFELYGKMVTRREPSFIFSMRAHHNPVEEYSYEFFLLHRKDGVSRATVLKKWIIRHICQCESR